jgi:hypothetical protein
MKSLKERKMNKEQWKQRLKEESIDEIGDQGFDVNDWGSYQYSGALAMFKTFRSIREDLSYHDTLAALGVKVEFSGKRNFKDIQAMVLKEFEDEEDCIFTDSTPLTKNVDDIFTMFKDFSWDLWSAASFLAPICFDGFALADVPVAPGFGPVLNQAVQSGNYETGLICALLVEHGMVVDTDCFVDFDT